MDTHDQIVDTHRPLIPDSIFQTREPLFFKGGSDLGRDSGRFLVARYNDRKTSGCSGLLRFLLEPDFEFVLNGGSSELACPELESEYVSQFQCFLEMAFGMDAREIIGFPQFHSRDAVAMEQFPLPLGGVVENPGEKDSAGSVYIGPPDFSFDLDGFHSLWAIVARLDPALNPSTRREFATDLH